jgi:hypothetical protein
MVPKPCLFKCLFEWLLYKRATQDRPCRKAATFEIEYPVNSHLDDGIWDDATSVLDQKEAVLKITFAPIDT